VRVLLVTANFRPSVGGIERFVEILAEGLAERGHQATVAACMVRGAPARETAGAVEIVRIPATNILRERLKVPYPIPAPRACVRTLRRLVERSDLVHVQDAEYLTSVASLVLARRLGVPSVLTQHVAFVSHGHPALDLVRRVVSRTLGRSARAADAVASYNPQVAKWAKRTWRLPYVHMLPIGVLPPAASADDRARVRRDLGLEEGAVMALFVGRDVPRKRLDVFLGAADPAYELVAVTDRVDSVPPGVRLLPFVAPDEFARMLAAADVFVLPSVGEGFPLALQEALVSGIPCIVTREPGYERFLAEEDVVFVPSEPEAVRAALRDLAADPERRRELSARGRAVGERKFGGAQFVEAYESLYETVRAEHGGRG
jgi:D-inositol-3-phosphate glycosyltransferase